jgi:hypothetical protein
MLIYNNFKNMECVVCFENFSKEKFAVKLACSHIMCHECSLSLSKNKILKCPICLREYEYLDEVPMSKTVEGMVIALQGEREIINNPKLQISIFIRTSKCSIAEFEVCIKDTVLQLKEKIRTLVKVETSSQWLLFNGRALQNSSTFESAGIGNGDVVYLVMREQRR